MGERESVPALTVHPRAIGSTEKGPTALLRLAGVASLVAGCTTLEPLTSSSRASVAEDVTYMAAICLIITGCGQLLGAIRLWERTGSGALMSGAALSVFAGLAWTAGLADGPEPWMPLVAVSLTGIGLARFALAMRVRSSDGRVLLAVGAGAAIGVGMMLLPLPVVEFHRVWPPVGLNTLLAVTFLAQGLWLVARGADSLPCPGIVSTPRHIRWDGAFEPRCFR